MVEIKKVRKKRPLKGFGNPPSSEDTKGNLDAPELAPSESLKGSAIQEARFYRPVFTEQFNTKVSKAFKEDFNALWQTLNKKREPDEPKISKGVILAEALKLYMDQLKRERKIS